MKSSTARKHAPKQKTRRPNRGNEQRLERRPKKHKVQTQIITHSLPKGQVIPKAEAPSPAHLELFQKEDCRNSHAVRTALTDLGLDYVAHSVPDGDVQKHENLVQKGGKDQIPFLIDHKTGMKLYESDSIINYLERRYGKPVKNSIVQNRPIASRISWAMRRPLDQARKLRRDFMISWRDSFETLRGSTRLLQSSFRTRVQGFPLRRRARS